MKSSGQNKVVDLVAGSERILRVHHRNMVHARYLENDLNYLDTVCKRNMNRVQQEIYNVYYSELLPLIESKKIMGGQKVKKTTNRFGLAGDGRVRQKCVFPNLNSNTPSNRSLPTVSVFTSVSDDAFSLPPVVDKSRNREKMLRKQPETSVLPLSVILKLPKKDRSGIISKWKEDFERCCPSVLSRADQTSSPNIDNDRLKIIKSAIALSSQPPPITDDWKKKRKLRRSFLVNLRRESRPVWNDNAMRRKGIIKQNSILSRGNSAKSMTTKKVENYDDISGFEHDKILPTLKSTNLTLTDDTNESNHEKSEQMLKYVQSLPDDDSSYLSSGDFFSEIDEEPSSFEESDYDEYSYSSYTGSSYTDYSGDDLSLPSDDER